MIIKQFLIKHAIVLTLLILLSYCLTAHYCNISSWSNSVPYGDASILAYLLSWGSHSLLSNPLKYYSPPIGYPFPYTLAGMDGMLIQTVFVLPFWHLFKNVALVYNLSLYFSFLFALLGSYFSAYTLVKTRISSLVVAIIFTITTDRFMHSNGHINLIYNGFLPIVFSSFYLLLQSSTKKRFISAAAALGLSVYASNYIFILAILTSACSFACYAGANREELNLKKVWTFSFAAFVGGLIALPIPLIHIMASSGLGINRTGGNINKLSANLAGWFLPPNNSLLISNYANLLSIPPDSPSRGENQQFMGILVFFWVVFESFRLLYTKISRTWQQSDRLPFYILLCVIFVFVCSFGPYLHIGEKEIIGPYYFLNELFLKYTKFFRVPSRLAFIVQWLFALLIGLSFNRIWGNFKITRYVLLVLVLIISWFEHVPSKTLDYYQCKPSPAVKHLDTIDPSGKQAMVIIPDPGSLGPIAFATTDNWRPMANAWPDNPLLKDYSLFFGAVTNNPESTSTLRILIEKNIRWIITTNPESKSKFSASSNYLFIKDFDDNTALFEIGNYDNVKTELDKAFAQKLNEINSLKKNYPTFELNVPSNSLKPIGGLDTAVTADSTRLILNTTKPQFASLSISLPPNFQPSVYKSMEVYYTMDNPTEHGACIYWSAPNIPASERTRIDTSVEDLPNGNYKATFNLESHPDWIWLDSIQSLRFDVYDQKEFPQQKIYISKIVFNN